MTYMPPLIIIGAHRSGTSLLAKLLHVSGVFMGAKRNQHDEAEFFFKQNERILRLAHAEWDIPAPVDFLLACKPIYNQLITEMEHRLAVEEARSFLGNDHNGQLESIKEQTTPWGWKDPRTTFTLPLWLRIFPEAKVLHVVRNGIDVAASLHKRETRRRNKLQNGRFSCQEQKSPLSYP